jgi:hypothetical protein
VAVGGVLGRRGLGSFELGRAGGAFASPLLNPWKNVPHVGPLVDALLAGLASVDPALEHGYGTLALRPAPGRAGRYYYVTDTSTLYRDNGASWDAQSAGGGASSGFVIALG